MDKVVVIIDGPGGIGKDSFIKVCEEIFFTQNISSIDPIKEIATYGGWLGEKTPKSRKMLADLKTVFTEYNDLPNKHVKSKINRFALFDDQTQILFVHIREPENFEVIKKYCDELKLPCVVLLVTGPHEKIGNRADDDFNYEYDFTFYNKPSETGIDKTEVISLVSVILDKTGCEPIFK